jgi:phosphatidylserine decarboxylase
MTGRMKMMHRSNTFILAEEGWRYVAGLVVAYLFFALIDAEVLQFLTAAALVAAVYMYRNPERIVPRYQPDSIVAPADGRVASVELLEACPVMDGACYKLVIRSKCLDTALLRIPFTAGVEHLAYRRGSRLSLSKPLSKELNEKARIDFSDEQGHKLVIEHLLAQTLDDISLRIVQGQSVTQGARYGLMVKGDHTLYLPKTCDLAVKSGDRVRAGESLIGYFS